MFREKNFFKAKVINFRPYISQIKLKTIIIMCEVFLKGYCPSRRYFPNGEHQKQSNKKNTSAIN